MSEFCHCESLYEEYEKRYDKASTNHLAFFSFFIYFFLWNPRRGQLSSQIILPIIPPIIPPIITNYPTYYPTHYANPMQYKIGQLSGV